jgi:hypothetical protein
MSARSQRPVGGIADIRLELGRGFHLYVVMRDPGALTADLDLGEFATTVADWAGRCCRGVNTVAATRFTYA